MVVDVFCDFCGKKLKLEEWRQCAFTSPATKEAANLDLCLEHHDFLLFIINVVKSDEEVKGEFEKKWNGLKASASHSKLE